MKPIDFFVKAFSKSSGISNAFLHFIKPPEDAFVL